MRFDDKDADELDGVRRDDRASYRTPRSMGHGDTRPENHRRRSSLALRRSRSGA